VRNARHPDGVEQASEAAAKEKVETATRKMKILIILRYWELQKVDMSE